MTVRLPSGESYASQVEKENRWLPYLQEQLDYPISKPVAVGKPTAYYPFPWSVCQWIEGEPLLECPNVEQKRFAKDLAQALKKLQAIDCSEGPKAGLHNFYRGGDLKQYHQETLDALEDLKDCLPVNHLEQIWHSCIERAYSGPEVWVHGDVAPGNILLRGHLFYGLIDFGILGVGDPACDYVMAWTYFDDASRKIFLEGLSHDMVQRAKGWALWKALVTYRDTNPDVQEQARLTIRTILNAEL